MTYKDSITAAMDELAKDPDVCFIGYGIRYGKAMGTLKNVPEAQLIETPVAENLMVGLAIGLSLRGRKPVVFIERADFLLNALDAIVNHLVKIDLMSRGQFKPAVMFRIIIGNKEKPLFTGETHTQDFHDALQLLVEKDGGLVWYHKELDGPLLYLIGHQRFSQGKSTFIFERKDLY